MNKNAITFMIVIVLIIILSLGVWYVSRISPAIMGYYQYNKGSSFLYPSTYSSSTQYSKSIRNDSIRGPNIRGGGPSYGK